MFKELLTGKSQLFTVQEVAQMLRVDDQTVYKWIKRGQLRAVKLGSNQTIRIPSSEIDKFLSPTKERAQG